MQVSNIDRVDFDIILVGSSLTNSILFSAFSRAGYKVLLLEPQSVNGFPHSTLSLRDFDEMINFQDNSVATDYNKEQTVNNHESSSSSVNSNDHLIKLYLERLKRVQQWKQQQALSSIGSSSSEAGEVDQDENSSHPAGDDNKIGDEMSKRLERLADDVITATLPRRSNQHGEKDPHTTNVKQYYAISFPETIHQPTDQPQSQVECDELESTHGKPRLQPWSQNIHHTSSYSDPDFHPTPREKNRTCIDLSPQLMYSRSEMVTAIVQGQLTDYLEFRALSQTYIGTITPSKTKHSAESSPEQQILHDMTLWTIPSSKSEIFKDGKLSLLAKNRLNTLLLILMHDPLNRQTTDEHLRLFDEYKHQDIRHLLQHINGNDVVADLVIYGICQWLDSITPALDTASASLTLADGSVSPSEEMDDNHKDQSTNESDRDKTVKTPTFTPTTKLTTSEASERVRLHLGSIGRYTPTPAIYPAYGMGEIASSWVYNGCVWGGYSILRCAIAALVIESDALTSTATCCGVLLSSGQLLSANYVVIDRTYFPVDHIQVENLATSVSTTVHAAVITKDHIIHDHDQDSTAQPVQTDPQKPQAQVETVVQEPDTVSESTSTPAVESVLGDSGNPNNDEQVYSPAELSPLNEPTKEPRQDPTTPPTVIVSFLDKTIQQHHKSTANKDDYLPSITMTIIPQVPQTILRSASTKPTIDEDNTTPAATATTTVDPEPPVVTIPPYNTRILSYDDGAGVCEEPYHLHLLTSTFANDKVHGNLREVYDSMQSQVNKLHINYTSAETLLRPIIQHLFPSTVLPQGKSTPVLSNATMPNVLMYYACYGHTWTHNHTSLAAMRYSITLNNDSMASIPLLDGSQHEQNQDIISGGDTGSTTAPTPTPTPCGQHQQQLMGVAIAFEQDLMSPNIDQPLFQARKLYDHIAPLLLQYPRVEDLTLECRSSSQDAQENPSDNHNDQPRVVIPFLATFKSERDEDGNILDSLERRNPMLYATMNAMNELEKQLQTLDGDSDSTSSPSTAIGDQQTMDCDEHPVDSNSDTNHNKHGTSSSSVDVPSITTQTCAAGEDSLSDLTAEIDQLGELSLDSLF